MKKNTLVGLALMGLGGISHAQSSNTISGVVDASLRHVRNSAGGLTSLSSGNNSTSRLIFRGTEDLGGGLRAGYWLESTLFTDSGTVGSGGMFFDRASYVSLSGEWGSVRLGRDYTPGFRAIAATDPFGYVGVGAAANWYNASSTTAFSRAFGTGATTFARSNNAVQYFTPANLGGFYAILMFAPSENANASGGFRHSSGRLGYATTDFDISATAATTRIEATGSNFRVNNLSGAYTLGALRLMGAFTQSSYLNSKQDVASLGGIWTVGSSEFKASYAQINQKGSNAAGASIDANDAKAFTVGYVFNLSKRSAVYATASHVTNKGRATYAVPTGPLGAAPGSASSGYEIGVRHSF